MSLFSVLPFRIRSDAPSSRFFEQMLMCSFLEWEDAQHLIFLDVLRTFDAYATIRPLIPFPVTFMLLARDPFPVPPFLPKQRFLIYWWTRPTCPGLKSLTYKDYSSRPSSGYLCFPVFLSLPPQFLIFWVFVLHTVVRATSPIPRQVVTILSPGTAQISVPFPDPFCSDPEIALADHLPLLPTP